MNARLFSDAISQLDDKYYAEAAAYTRKKRAWGRWAALAACLCLVAGVGVLRPWEKPDNTPAALESPPPTVSTEPQNTARPTAEADTVVRGYESEAEVSYRAPSPGEIRWTIEVQDALDAYAGQDAAFLLTFDLFQADGGGVTEATDDMRQAEYARLAALGYALYETPRWTYGGAGEKVWQSVVVGYFTAEELAAFAGNPDYGYMFRFAENGDGSGVYPAEEDRIS